MAFKKSAAVRTIICCACLNVCLFLFPMYLHAESKLTVYTVNYPLKYFAERIGGKHVNVVFPAPPDLDPAYWKPDREVVAEYQKADLILLNGAHYAKWTEKVSLPGARMVDTSRKYKDRYIRKMSAITHSHGPEGDHAHEDAAFTVWLDFNIAAGQAKAIEKALGRKMPDLRPELRINYESLEKDLMAMDKEINRIVSRDTDKPIVFSHPVYDYLSERYHMNTRSVHWEPGEVPKNAQLMELKEMLGEHPSQWMIWEGQPLEESVDRLKSMGVKSTVFDPCGNTPEKGDFLAVMHQNAENLKLVYE